MPREPPVLMSPQARLLARLRPGEMPSVVTFFQSHSSSSATSCARPVSVPWPISERAMRITQVSSGLTTTHAPISAPAALCASADPDPNGRRTPRASPPAATVEPTMNERRENLEPAALMFFMSRLLSSGHVHRRADPLIGAAPADVGHRVVDVLVGRLRLLRQERGRCHDLPGLAVPALRHVDGRPRFLDRVRAIGRQAFDRDYLVGGLHVAHRQGAGAHDLAVEVHGAGAALRDAASVLGARQPDLLADHPEQRRVGLHLHVTDLAVDVQLRHGALPPAIVADSGSGAEVLTGSPEAKML